MYQLTVIRDFIARHYLIGGDWGDENQPHSHHYRAEVQLEGATLDEHGYLVDIVTVEAAFDRLIDRYRDALLNDLPEFAGLNPSLEHFARIFATALAEEIQTPNLTALAVRLWEHETAWAAYRLALSAQG